jgi:hypothetical protein
LGSDIYPVYFSEIFLQIVISRIFWIFDTHVDIF